MASKTALEELDSKITLILEKYDALKEQNRRLEASLLVSKESEAKLQQELNKVKEEEELKELELEDIALRIGKSLGDEKASNISIAS